eukprot:TRINITY_DN1852_c0_g1_i8.p2 TRINITY_DN1852_c0_g1~~TRINITY_DN1852_c0_g1_i8.p2  ORF type:complete len:295 (-),score=-23.60 TRINITY_DN1852_c0_g1_i8:368-1252(-)
MSFNQFLFSYLACLLSVQPLDQNFLQIFVLPNNLRFLNYLKDIRVLQIISIAIVLYLHYQLFKWTNSCLVILVAIGRYVRGFQVYLQICCLHVFWTLNFLKLCQTFWSSSVTSDSREQLFLFVVNASLKNSVFIPQFLCLLLQALVFYKISNQPFKNIYLNQIHIIFIFYLFPFSVSFYIFQYIQNKGHILQVIRLQLFVYLFIYILLCQYVSPYNTSGLRKKQNFNKIVFFRITYVLVISYICRQIYVDGDQTCTSLRIYVVTTPTNSHMFSSFFLYSFSIIVFPDFVFSQFC